MKAFELTTLAILLTLPACSEKREPLEALGDCYPSYCSTGAPFTVCYTVPATWHFPDGSSTQDPYVVADYCLDDQGLGDTDETGESTGSGPADGTSGSWPDAGVDEFCSGEPKPCADRYTLTSCYWQPGCEWIGPTSNGVCQGTPMACEAMGNEEDCLGHIGCQWGS